MTAKHFVGDVGTVLRFTIKDQDGGLVDISTAGTIEVKLRRADRTTDTRTAVFTTDGTDSKMQYVTVAGDFTAVGPYGAKPFVDIAGSFTGHGTEYLFNVFTV